MVCEKEEILLSAAHRIWKSTFLIWGFFSYVLSLTLVKLKSINLGYSTCYLCIFFKNKCLFFIYLAAMTLSGGKWDLVSHPGMEPGPTALEVWSLSYWTTREVLKYLLASTFCIAMPVLWLSFKVKLWDLYWDICISQVNL